MRRAPEPGCSLSAEAEVSVVASTYPGMSVEAGPSMEVELETEEKLASAAVADGAGPAGAGGATKRAAIRRSSARLSASAVQSVWTK